LVLARGSRRRPETIHFGLLSDTEAIYLEKLLGRRKYQMTSRVGKSLPLLCTSIDKAVLAFLPDGQLEELLPPLRAP
jgi:DNA-binding IclR family transcriptional regulator